MSLKTIVTISKTSQVSTADAPFWGEKKRKFRCKRKKRDWHLDFLCNWLWHHLAEKVVALLHLHIQLCHTFLDDRKYSPGLWIMGWWIKCCFSCFSFPPSASSSRFLTPVRPSTHWTVGYKDKGLIFRPKLSEDLEARRRSLEKSCMERSQMKRPAACGALGQGWQ